MNEQAPFTEPQKAQNSLPREVYRIPEGSTATITCELSIDADTAVKWFKDGAEFTKGQSLQEGKHYQLVIAEASMAETGIYSVLINNEQHTVAQVIVEGKKRTVLISACLFLPQPVHLSTFVAFSYNRLFSHNRCRCLA